MDFLETHAGLGQTFIHSSHETTQYSVRYSYSAIVLSEESEGSCCHDYDESWKCKLCGYKLPPTLVERINQPLKKRREPEGEE